MDTFKSVAHSFRFLGWDVSGSNAQFQYEIIMNDGSSHQFTERIDFGVALDSQQASLKAALDSLHLALGISYYKLYVPHSFDLSSISLTNDQASFWNTVYLNGLGEFLYTNKLHPSLLARFSATLDSAPDLFTQYKKDTHTSTTALLGIGGGKDSIVAGELLKEIGINVAGFVLENSTEDAHTTAIAQEMNVQKHVIKRTLDPSLLELNNQPHALNGHIPISAIFAFAGTVLASALHIDLVVVGNEASASIPNTTWDNMEINHQWSKSFQFEQLAQDYIHNYISPEITYFSAIRPLSSFAVCRLMSRMPHYFNLFTSCNRVARINPDERPNDRWCGECAKCLSTFIMLGPWLTEAELLGIFSKNLFDNTKLQDLLLALTGVQGIKPLDCVGTTEEIVLALNIIEKQHKFKDSALMNVARENNILHNNDTTNDLNMLLRLNDEQAFPESIKNQLFNILKLGEQS